MCEAFVSFANGTFGATEFNTSFATTMFNAFVSFANGTFGASWFNTTFAAAM
jgi:hypothetical protein